MRQAAACVLVVVAAAFAALLVAANLGHYLSEYGWKHPDVLNLSGILAAAVLLTGAFVCLVVRWMVLYLRLLLSAVGVLLGVALVILLRWGWKGDFYPMPLVAAGIALLSWVLVSDAAVRAMARPWRALLTARVRSSGATPGVSVKPSRAENIGGSAGAALWLGLLVAIITTGSAPGLFPGGRPLTLVAGLAVLVGSYVAFGLGSFIGGLIARIAGGIGARRRQ